MWDMRQIAADFEWWFTGVGIFGGKGALSAAQSRTRHLVAMAGGAEALTSGQ